MREVRRDRIALLGRRIRHELRSRRIEDVAPGAGRRGVAHPRSLLAAVQHLGEHPWVAVGVVERRQRTIPGTSDVSSNLTPFASRCPRAASRSVTPKVGTVLPGVTVSVWPRPIDGPNGVVSSHQPYSSSS